MTEEEKLDLAIDWIRSQGWNEENLPSDEFLQMKQAFLAGLKAGRPKWHKVADGDLPEAENHFWSRTVLLQTNKDSSIIGFYDHANKAWYEKETDDIVYGVIAWCEIPKYTEE